MNDYMDESLKKLKQGQLPLLLLLSGNWGKSRLEWKVCEGSIQICLFIHSIYKT